MEIRFQAWKDAWIMHREIIRLELASDNVKAIARKQALEKYPRATNQERGLYVHCFLRKIRYYEIQTLHDEWSRDGGF
jgi:hypothetical protein